MLCPAPGFGGGGGGEPSEPAFVSTWETTNTSTGSSNSDQVALPLTSAGTYDFTVDWGDGSQDEITAYDQAEVTHTYAASGEYEITITGTITGWQFAGTGDRLKLLDVSQWGPFNPGSTGKQFSNCGNLVVSAEDAMDSAGVTNVENMLDRCFSLTAINLDGLVSSLTTNIRLMLRQTGISDLSSAANWDTSNVEDMAATFRDMVSLSSAPVDQWDVSSVLSMADMFAEVTLDTDNYDDILFAWEAQAVQNNVSFNGGNSQYTPGGAAEAARTALVNDHSWTITDGGAAS